LSVERSHIILRGGRALTEVSERNERREGAGRRNGIRGETVDCGREDIDRIANSTSNKIPCSYRGHKALKELPQRAHHVRGSSVTFFLYLLHAGLS
jgi:hypothetical protein